MAKARKNTMPDTLRRFLRAQVEAGVFASEAEAIAAGVKLLRERHELRLAEIRELRRQIARGVEAADRGDVHDADTVFAALRRRARQRRASA